MVRSLNHRSQRMTLCTCCILWDFPFFTDMDIIQSNSGTFNLSRFRPFQAGNNTLIITVNESNGLRSNALDRKKNSFHPNQYALLTYSIKSVFISKETTISVLESASRNDYLTTNSIDIIANISATTPR